MVRQYHELCKEILTSSRSNYKMGSKGSGLISLFGAQKIYDLREGFPLLTTKKMYHKGIIHELIWFLRGDTNIRYLEDNNVKIWRRDAFQHNLPRMIKEGIFPANMPKYSKEWEDALDEYAKMIIENKNGFAEIFGDAGPIYGKQWTAWPYFDKEKGEVREINQLRNMIEGLKKKPTGKKHIVSAWQPGDVPHMSLPPCHTLYQATSDGKGNLELHLCPQRSCDTFLGIPYNVASYVMLTQIIAQETGMTPKTFVHTTSDTHFYSGLEKRGKWYNENFEELQEKVRDAVKLEEKTGNKTGYLEVLDWINNNAPRDENEEKYDHVTAVLEQLSRDFMPLSKMEIAKKPFDELTIEDFTLTGYKGNHHPPIIREMAV